MESPIIEVKHASIRFNLAMQRQQGLGDYVKRLIKRELLFQEFFALKDINLSIRAGESWAFVGRNGSGKSTLLKMIAGILRPYNGSVDVRGKVAPLLELGAGFDAELTGRENIMMNGLILGMTKKEVQQHFEEIVDFAELRDFLDIPVKNYSSGMKSRLGFSIATSIKPQILIADEVLATGDRAFQMKCEERMKELLSGGTTLLFVSHSAAAVKRMCDNALWLDNGTERMKGKTADVMSAYEKEVQSRK